jgi:hypothetical protein
MSTKLGAHSRRKRLFVVLIPVIEIANDVHHVQCRSFPVLIEAAQRACFCVENELLRLQIVNSVQFLQS